MRLVAEVQISPWQRGDYILPEGDFFEVGSFVIVDEDFGEELGRLKKIKKEGEDKGGCSDKKDCLSGCSAASLKKILRLASAKDLDLARENERSREECREAFEHFTEKYNLPMKLVGVHFSLEGSRLTFAFIADGRIDFRELVKDLTRKFQTSIRLHQIGVRDEAKISGDLGPCGRNLCCQGAIKEDYGGVSTEMAYDQQVAHRGLERLSGACGRLKCCLRYELPMYEKLKKNLPPIGSQVSLKNKKEYLTGRGEVVGWQVLKQTVKVEFKKEDGENIVEVPLNDIKG